MPPPIHEPGRLSSLAPPAYRITASPEPIGSGARSEISLPRAGLDVHRGLRSSSPTSQPRSSTSSPDLTGGGVGEILSLFLVGWNPDLPNPAHMRHMYVLIHLAWMYYGANTNIVLRFSLLTIPAARVYFIDQRFLLLWTSAPKTLVFPIQLYFMQ